MDGERYLIVEVLKAGGEDAERWRKSEAASKGKSSIPSDLSIISPVTSSVMYSPLCYAELPPPSCPAPAFPAVLSAICCPTEKIKQQGDSV